MYMLYKDDELRFTVYSCYSWEMALKMDLDVSFNNSMCDLK
jgi:hypothetical protein